MVVMFASKLACQPHAGPVQKVEFLDFRDRVRESEDASPA